MNWLDITTYFSLNGDLFYLWIVMTVTSVCISVSVYAENRYDRERNEVKASRLYIGIPLAAFVTFFVIFVASLLPSHERILEVKISRLKNEAVNRESIMKGVETLERIGKKLECKYLGGCE